MSTDESIPPHGEGNLDKWLRDRLGKVTASRVKDVMSKLKSGKESAARATYRMELLAETVTGSAALLWQPGRAI